MSIWPGGEGWGQLRPSRSVGLRVVRCGWGRWWWFGAGARTGFAGRVAPEVRVVVSGRGGRGQAGGVGSALRRWNATARSLAQGQLACSRSVAVRAWNARRAATCSSR